jgi:eukaryotic translation initiation factor 2C
MIGDTSLGVITQCMQVTHVKKASVAYVANVVAKVNMKLDGVNQVVEKKDLAFIAQAPTMIIGVDVSIITHLILIMKDFILIKLDVIFQLSHPSPGQSYKPSISAVVGSMDATCTRYVSKFAIQGQREVTGSGEQQRRRGPRDSIEMIGTMIHQLLETFQKRNGCTP